VSVEYSHSSYNKLYKRRDTDLFTNNDETVTLDSKPAVMMHPILPLASIGFQPIDESKQQILDDQDTITNGNILPVVCLSL
jgi:hypothetical protein